MSGLQACFGIDDKGLSSPSIVRLQGSAAANPSRADYMIHSFLILLQHQSLTDMYALEWPH